MFGQWRLRCDRRENSRTDRRSRPAPIILDDEDSDVRAETPDDDLEQLPDLLDLFSSDPVDGLTMIAGGSRVSTKVDRKGKAKAVEPLPPSRPAVSRARSPDLDGIEDVDLQPKRRKRKSTPNPGDDGTKRARAVSLGHSVSGLCHMSYLLGLTRRSRRNHR